MNKNKIVSKRIFLIAIIFVMLILIFRFIKQFNIQNASKNFLNNVLKEEGIDINDLKTVDDFGAALCLTLAIENDSNWKFLPLSDTFRKKYKNSKAIIPEKNKYERYLDGQYIDEHGNNILIIFATEYAKAFDFNDDNTITTEYHYKYIVNDLGQLDEIELIKKINTYAVTGESISELQK